VVLEACLVVRCLWVYVFHKLRYVEVLAAHEIKFELLNVEGGWEVLQVVAVC